MFCAMEQSTLFKQLPGLEGNSISCQIFSPPNHVPCQLIGQTSYIHAAKSFLELFENAIFGAGICSVDALQCLA